jgi:hypothetical protein
MSDDDRDVLAVLADMIREFEPVDRVMDVFERGGPQCAKRIERLHDCLIDLAQRIRGHSYDDSDDEADVL